MTSKLLYLLLSASILGGCATSNPEPPASLPPIVLTKTVNVYPTPPRSTDLTCPPDPVAPDPDKATVEEGFVWAEAERVTGGDCRGKLDSLRMWIEGWPK